LAVIVLPFLVCVGNFLTYAALQEFYKNLIANETDQPTTPAISIEDKLRDLSSMPQERLAEKCFAAPYYWAAFYLTGGLD